MNLTLILNCIGSINFDIAHVTRYKMHIFFNQSQSKVHHHDSEIILQNIAKKWKYTKYKVYKVFYIAHPIGFFLVHYRLGKANADSPKNMLLLKKSPFYSIITKLCQNKVLMSTNFHNHRVNIVCFLK